MGALGMSGVFCLVLVVFALVSRIFSSYPAVYKTFTVDSAVLAVLNPTTSTSTSSSSISTLRYHLAVNITFRTFDSIVCHDVAATAFYNDSILGVSDYWIPPAPPSVWDSPTVKEVGWSSSFQGTLVVYPSVAAELEGERAEGTVHVRVRVSASFTVYETRGRRHYVIDDVSMYDCWLWFPPPGDGAPAFFGEGTECWPAK